MSEINLDEIKRRAAEAKTLMESIGVKWRLDGDREAFYSPMIARLGIDRDGKEWVIVAHYPYPNGYRSDPHENGNAIIKLRELAPALAGDVEALVAEVERLRQDSKTPLLTTNDEMQRTYLTKDQLIESHAKYIVKLETELEQLRRERGVNP